MPWKRHYKCYVFARVHVIRANTLGTGFGSKDFIIKNRFESPTMYVGRIGGIAHPWFTVISFGLEHYGKPSRFFRPIWRGLNETSRVWFRPSLFFIRTRIRCNQEKNPYFSIHTKAMVCRLSRPETVRTAVDDESGTSMSVRQVAIIGFGRGTFVKYSYFLLHGLISYPLRRFDSHLSAF